MSSHPETPMSGPDRLLHHRMIVRILVSVLQAIFSGNMINRL